MTDEDGNGGRGGSGNGSDPPRPQSLLDIATRRESSLAFFAGLAFVSSALITLILLAFAGGILLYSDASSAKHDNLSAALLVRVSQVALTVMAVSVIVALIVRFRNVWGLTFGLIVIGALIVPANEIVRFLLLITGSEREYRALYTPEAQYKIRETDSRDCIVYVDDRIIERLRRQIYPYLKDSGSDQSSIISHFNSNNFVDEVMDILAREIYFYTARDAVNTATAGGSFESFKAVAQGNAQAFTTAHRANDLLYDQFLLLRAEGLISFPFDRMGSAVLTPLGQVAYAHMTESQLAGEPITDGPGKSLEACGRQAVASFGDESPSVPSDRSGFVQLIVDHNEPVRVANTNNGLGWLLVDIDELGTFRIDVRATESNQDPIAFLYDEQGELLGSDDDSGGGLNSRFERVLQPGLHFIAVRNLRTGVAQFDVRIRSAEAVEAASNPPQVNDDYAEIDVDTESRQLTVHYDDLTWFKINTGRMEGQLTVEARGVRELDPVLAIYDSESTRIEEVDDNIGQSRDARISLRVEADTDYLWGTVRGYDAGPDEAVEISTSFEPSMEPQAESEPSTPEQQ